MKKADNGSKPKAEKPPVIPPLRHPKTLLKVAKHASQFTYTFARLREKSGQTEVQTLGTCFLVGKNRMLTCSHCINDLAKPNFEMAHHVDGDSYLFVQKDEDGNGHQAVIKPKAEETLFTFPDFDSAVFHLPDEFYQVDGVWILNPDNYLHISNKVMSIGADVGVLGYPMQEITVNEHGVDYTGIRIRTDKGVVNTKYFDGVGNLVYEFTMAFNPGNSGGPIFDLYTGHVIGMVHGFTTFLTSMVGNNPVYSNYSMAVGSECLRGISKEHDIIFSRN